MSLRDIVPPPAGRDRPVEGRCVPPNKVGSVELAESADGTVSETVVLTDRFVPVIRGIDFTPGPGFGAIVTIQ